MTVHRIEIGLVSHTNDTVAFYREVFGLEELEPRSFPVGVVHRLGYQDALVKIMIPADPPAMAAQQPGPFWAVAGLRSFTFWVDDLDSVIARISPQGGSVDTAPMELRPGIRTAVVKDPLGNTIEVMEDRS